MIDNPTPTRAEVTDIALAISQRTDSIMLSGETAIGLYPFKAISVMNTVSERIERKVLDDKHLIVEETSDPKMEIARSACILANNIKSNNHDLLSSMANDLADTKMEIRGRASLSRFSMRLPRP